MLSPSFSLWTLSKAELCAKSLHGITVTASYYMCLKKTSMNPIPRGWGHVDAGSRGCGVTFGGWRAVWWLTLKWGWSWFPVTVSCVNILFVIWTKLSRLERKNTAIWRQEKAIYRIIWTYDIVRVQFHVWNRFTIYTASVVHTSW